MLCRNIAENRARGAAISLPGMQAKAGVDVNEGPYERRHATPEFDEAARFYMQSGPVGDDAHCKTVPQERVKFVAGEGACRECFAPSGAMN